MWTCRSRDLPLVVDDLDSQQQAESVALCLPVPVRETRRTCLRL